MRISDWSSDVCSSDLSDPVLFDNYTSQICARTGYDTGNAQQMTRCRQQLGAMGQMMLGRPLSAQAFLTHILLGNTVGDDLFEDSPASAARVMAHRDGQSVVVGKGV